MTNPATLAAVIEVLADIEKDFSPSQVKTLLFKAGYETPINWRPCVNLHLKALLKSGQIKQIRHSSHRTEAIYRAVALVKPFALLTETAIKEALIEWIERHAGDCITTWPGMDQNSQSVVKPGLPVAWCIVALDRDQGVVYLQRTYDLVFACKNKLCLNRNHFRISSKAKKQHDLRKGAKIRPLNLHPIDKALQWKPPGVING